MSNNRKSPSSLLEDGEIERVLDVLAREGALEHMTFIGGFSQIVLREYLGNPFEIPAKRTEDIDILLERSRANPFKSDIVKKLEEIGYMRMHSPLTGALQLISDRGLIQFLVPEIGRGDDKPYSIPGQSIRAEQLRYLDIARDHRIWVPFRGRTLVVPHPGALAVGKLLVAPLRKDGDKRKADMATGIALLEYIAGHREWQKGLVEVVEELSDKRIKAVSALLEDRDELGAARELFLGIAVKDRGLERS